jgi:regulation of enolase protein 1 (concanavalin A-like superfamily)
VPERPRRRRRRAERPAGSPAALALGIIALICGVLAGFGSLLPALRFLSLTVAGLGLVLGLVALVLGLVRGGSPVGWSVAGLVVSSVALAVTAAVMVVGDVGGAAASTSDWGSVTDPDGDCTVQVNDDLLVMQIPGRPHDLSAELGIVNAPRSMLTVNGDFEAEVTVTRTLRPGDSSTIPGRLPFNGAGLLLWRDPDNYIRLERCGVNRDGQSLPYVGFEMRLSGQMAQAFSQPPSWDGPVHLRMRRRGEVVEAYFRTGLPGATQRDERAFPALNFPFGDQVQVGVAACNSSTAPLAVRFERFRLKKE